MVWLKVCQLHRGMPTRSGGNKGLEHLVVEWVEQRSGLCVRAHFKTPWHSPDTKARKN